MQLLLTLIILLSCFQQSVATETGTVEFSWPPPREGLSGRTKSTTSPCGSVTHASARHDFPLGTHAIAIAVGFTNTTLAVQLSIAYTNDPNPSTIFEPLFTTQTLHPTLQQCITLRTPSDIPPNTNATLQLTYHDPLTTTTTSPAQKFYTCTDIHYILRSRASSSLGPCPTTSPLTDATEMHPPPRPLRKLPSHGMWGSVVMIVFVVAFACIAKTWILPRIRRRRGTTTERGEGVEMRKMLA